MFLENYKHVVKRKENIRIKLALAIHARYKQKQNIKMQGLC